MARDRKRRCALALILFGYPLVNRRVTHKLVHGLFKRKGSGYRRKKELCKERTKATEGKQQRTLENRLAEDELEEVKGERGCT